MRMMRMMMAQEKRGVMMGMVMAVVVLVKVGLLFLPRKGLSVLAAEAEEVLKVRGIIVGFWATVIQMGVEGPISERL